jgi:hypothetical protein
VGGVELWVFCEEGGGSSYGCIVYGCRDCDLEFVLDIDVSVEFRQVHLAICIFYSTYLM